MHIDSVTLAEVGRARGAVVVIDVLRAFTVAALALDAGAAAVRCVRTVDEALAARAANPGSLAIGEHNRGRRVPEFDLGNSPTGLLEAELRGRLLIQRTSAGTQGLVAAAAIADVVFAASFVCARATATALREADPAAVTFVLTGVDERDGDEDRACAEYIAALLDSSDVDPAPYTARVWTSGAAKAFTTGDEDFPASDVEHAVRVNTVGFALRAHVDGNGTTLVASPPRSR